MKLIRYEILKLVSSKYMRAVFVFLLLCGFILSWFTSRPNAYDSAVISAYDDYLENKEAVVSYYNELETYINEHITTDEELNLPHTYFPDSGYDDAFILSKVLERASYLSGYPDKINGIIGTAGKRINDLTFMGFPESDYEVRHQKRLVSRMTAIADDVSGECGYSYGFDTFIENKAVILLVMVFSVLSAGFIFLNDRLCGMNQVIVTTPRGRYRTVVSKILSTYTVTFAGTAAIFAVCLFGAGVSCGFSSFSAPIQSIPVFSTVPFSCTTGAFLLIVLCSRILAALVLASLTAVLAILIPEYYFVIPSSVSAAAVLSVIYYRKFSGTVPAARYLNPVSLAEAAGLYEFFRDVNIFGRPVNVCVFAVILAVISVLILSAAAIPGSRSVRVHPAMPRRKTKAPRPDTRKTAAVRKKAEKHGFSLWTYELYKYRIPVLTAVLLLCMAASGVYSAGTGGTMEEYSEALYYSYIRKAAELPPAEREKYIAEEEMRLRTVISQYEYYTDLMETGTLPKNEYNDFLNSYYDAKAAYSVFESVKSNVRNTTVQSEKYGIDVKPIYDTGINRYNGNVPDWFALFVIILICADSYPIEYEGKNDKSFYAILHSTKRGRANTLSAKLCFCAAFGSAVSLGCRLMKLIVLRGIYIFPDTSVPVCALRQFNNILPGVSIGQWLVFDLLLTAIGGGLSAVVTCALSKISGKLVPAVCTSSIVLLGWDALAASKLGKYNLSILSFTRPSVLVSGSAGTIWSPRYLFMLLAHVIICGIIVIVCCSPDITGHRAGRRT